MPPKVESHHHGRCWSCQYPIEPATTVEIAEEIIPCCSRCWVEIPVGQRMVIAQRFEAALREPAVLGDVRRLIRRLLEDSPGRMDWLLGSGEN